MGVRLPFNRPHIVGRELDYIRDAIARGHLSGDGDFTLRCHTWLEERLEVPRALLTTSCTTALELSALLIDVQPGDEVIMPSFTFVSTAAAFALRGATPVFVDIRSDTLNLDERLVADAVTPRTRAIVAVHYAGVGCDMDALGAIAQRHGLVIVEDAAQALLARYRDRPLGGLGHLAAISFHDTKNVVAGEAGALAVNDPRFTERAEILREKGTNRAKFFRGEVDRYTWTEVGSSFLPNEITAAFLLAQLEEADNITRTRLGVWDWYHAALEPAERRGLLRRPVVPADCRHNAHIYYVLVADLPTRSALIAMLRERGIDTRFHYVPLHSSPVGAKLARSHGDLALTTALSERLVRLPLWPGLTESDVAQVAEAVTSILSGDRP